MRNVRRFLLWLNIPIRPVYLVIVAVALVIFAVSPRFSVLKLPEALLVWAALCSGILALGAADRPRLVPDFDLEIKRHANTVKVEGETCHKIVFKVTNTSHFILQDPICILRLPLTFQHPDSESPSNGTYHSSIYQFQKKGLTKTRYEDYVEWTWPVMRCLAEKKDFVFWVKMKPKDIDDELDITLWAENCRSRTKTYPLNPSRLAVYEGQL